MKALAETVFIGEIVLQSKIAELAAKRLSESKDNFDQIEVWSSIQSILVTAGNVSKILWPSKEYAERIIFFLIANSVIISNTMTSG